MGVRQRLSHWVPEWKVRARKRPITWTDLVS